MTLKDYYKILQVSRNSSASEIKSAYYSLSKQFHPDSTGNTEDSEKFQEINEAYRILSNKFNRVTFDSYLDFTENPDTYKNTERKNRRRPHRVRRQFSGEFHEYLNEELRRKMLPTLYSLFITTRIKCGT